jgi:hypothetical protein
MAGPHLFSGIANMGNAFMKSYIDTQDRNRRRKREDEEDAWRNEERESIRDERERKRRLNQELQENYESTQSAPGVMAGTVTQGSAGKVFSADPQTAAAMQETLAAEAELKGEAAPTQQQGYGVPTKESTGSQIKTGKAPENNSSDAYNEGALKVLRRNGQFEEAMRMENMIIEQKAKRMGLKIDEFKYLDISANRELQERVPFTATWWDGAANMINQIKEGPLAGLTAEPVLSKDGKTVDMFAVGPDGKRQKVWSLPSDESGWQQFMEMSMKADLGARLQVLRGVHAAEREQANKDRDFDLRKSESESNQQYRNRMLDIQASQEKRLSEAHNEAMQDAKIPPGVKMAAASLAKQIESVNSALNKAMAEGQFDPNNPGTARLLTQQAELGIQYQKLMQPYITGQSAPNARLPDASMFAPKGSSADQPSAAPSSSGAPRQSQQSGANRTSDALVILQSEMEAAQRRLASGDARAQADIAALQREIERAGGPATSMAKAAPPAAGVTPSTNRADAVPSAPSAPVTSMQSVVTSPARSVAQVLAGPGASPALVSAANQKAQAIEAAAAQVKAAQAAVVKAAQSGDQAAVKAAMDQVSGAGKGLREMLSNMNPQQAALVLKAVGLQ